MSITKALTRGILRDPLKVIGLIFLLNYTVIWQRVAKGALTKPRPIGAARSERENPNFTGMSLTKERIKRILRGPLKFFGPNPLLNRIVI